MTTDPNKQTPGTTVSLLSVHLAGKDIAGLKNYLSAADEICTRAVRVLCTELQNAAEDPPAVQFLQYKHDQAAALLKLVRDCAFASKGIREQELITYGE